jgi:hypothetical protein
MATEQIRMLDNRLEVLMTPAGRRELDVLAADLGVSAAAVVRLAVRKMSAAHSRKARRDVAAARTPPVAAPDAAPAPPPSIAAMDLPALLKLRDELALQTSPEASRKHAEVNQEIIKRQMFAQWSAPR